jgi:hypothetical protein
MLFPTLRRSHGIFNQKLHNYGLNSTYESIKKLLYKNDEERKRKIKFNIVSEESVSNPSPPNNPFIPVLIFLSISSIIYYFYNSKK